MRWLLRRHKADPESKKALESATANLHKTRERGDEVREVSTALRVMRERNHFREQLEAIMGGC